ncbi:MAG: hypothetical protein U0797_28870, partial [Gemmataceae bacterium]
DVGGRPAAQVAKMPPAEVLLRYFSLYYHEYRDEVYKGTYLPYLQARPVFLEADKRLKELTGPDATEAARLPAALLPAIAKVQLAQARLERKLAALRVIEALRMHAAATGGTLPNRLADVKVVPVPNDPGTGQPFEYRLDGGIATITSRVAGEPLATNGLRYRVTLRK